MNTISSMMITFLFILSTTFGIGSSALSGDGGGVTLTISESVIHVNTGDDLDLDCLSRLGIKSDVGPLVRLTDGFYPVPEKYKDFMEGGKYRLKYDMLPNAGGWRFRLVNNGVGPEDGGTYTCSLLGQRGAIIAHSSVRVIVDN